MNYWHRLQIKRLKTLQQQHINKESTGRLKSKIQIWSNLVTPFSQCQFYHKSCWTWSMWGWYKLGNISYGDSGAGPTFPINNKSGITKVGQKILVSDVHRIRPCVYMNRHKFHVKPTECDKWGKTNASKSQRCWSWWWKYRRGKRKYFSVKTHTSYGIITAVGFR